MPAIKVNGVELFYKESGSGAETIVFSHGYLMTHEMFGAQLEVFQDHFRCIAYDHRGHGRSQVTENGYEMENLTADGAALLAALSPDTPCHFVGMSTGGYVGLRLAIYRPELLKSLILIDTDAETTSPEKLREYELMLFILKYLGVRPIVGRTMSILFGQKFIKDRARHDQVKFWRQRIGHQNRSALVKFGKGIFYRPSVLDQLGAVKVPTAVIVGEQDVPTPIALSERMAAGIADSSLHLIPDAGHTSPVEEPAAVNRVMKQFYEKLGILPS